MRRTERGTRSMGPSWLPCCVWLNSQPDCVDRPESPGNVATVSKNLADPRLSHPGGTVKLRLYRLEAGRFASRLKARPRWQGSGIPGRWPRRSICPRRTPSVPSIRFTRGAMLTPTYWKWPPGRRGILDPRNGH